VVGFGYIIVNTCIKVIARMIMIMMIIVIIICGRKYFCVGI